MPNDDFGLNEEGKRVYLGPYRDDMDIKTCVERQRSRFLLERAELLEQYLYGGTG